MKLTASSHRLSVAGFRVGRAREEWRERRGRKKKEKKDSTMLLSACFSSDHFNEQQTSKQAHVSVKLGWSITPTTKLGSRLLPGPRGLPASFEDFWRSRFCQIFSLEKIIRVNLISSLVACFPFTILKRFQVQPDPLFKRLLKVCQVVRPCFFVT